MNRLSSQQRKLVYLACIVILLIPIIALGMPGTSTGGAGGRLSQLRREYELGESTIGQVDPSSATMNLVLLGMRGVAASALWMEAIDLQETKDWGKLRSTVNSIILLQPHFQEVWRFQGWNLAYNVSASWDDIEDRFYWVKEGIKFVDVGTQRNRKSTELYWDMGRFTGPKIGISDEWRYFRKFFVSDPDMDRYEGLPDPDVNPGGMDNYLVARSWFMEANDVELKYGQHVMARCLFRKCPAGARMDLAMVLQREGTFGEQTRVEWERGFQELTQVYGQERFDGLVGPFDGKYQMESSEEVIQALAKENGIEVDAQRYGTQHYQKMVNYHNWRTIALASRDKLTMDAHREIYDGKQLFKLGRTSPRGENGEKPSESRAMLESGMAKFEQMLEKYPVLITHDDVIEEGLMATQYYLELLKLNDLPVPGTFALKSLRDSQQARLDNIAYDFRLELAGIK